jgi:phage gp37-like protein
MPAVETSPIKQIEEAMVAALKAAMPDVLVESYAGQLDDEQAEWMRRLPCVWVTFERTTNVKRLGRLRYRNTGRFQVMAAQRALGPEPAARLGGFGQAGVYELLDQHAKRALADQNLGLAIEPFAPRGLAMVVQGYFGNDAASVMSSAWETVYIEVIPEAEATPPGELKTIGLTYVLKPGDDVPDAADVVTLNP